MNKTIEKYDKDGREYIVDDIDHISFLVGERIGPTFWCQAEFRYGSEANRLLLVLSKDAPEKRFQVIEKRTSHRVASDTL